MEKVIKDAIQLLAEKVDKSIKSEDSLRFTQSALNLAHVLSMIDNINKR